MKKAAIRYYEGFFSWREGLYKKLKSKLLNFQGPMYLVKWDIPLITMGHLTKGLMNDIVNRWLNQDDNLKSLSVHGSAWHNKMPLDSRTNIVIGHSFGAHRALSACKTAGHEIDLLVLFDIRWIFGNHNFKKPANVKKCIHFYQKGFLRGYEVEGAENIHLDGTHHGSVDNDLDAIGRVMAEIFD